MLQLLFSAAAISKHSFFSQHKLCTRTSVEVGFSVKNPWGFVIIVSVYKILFLFFWFYVQWPCPHSSVCEITAATPRHHIWPEPTRHKHCRWPTKTYTLEKNLCYLAFMLWSNMRSGPVGDMHRFAMTEQLKSKTSCISMISVCLTNTPQIAHMVSVRTGQSG